MCHVAEDATDGIDAALMLLDGRIPVTDAVGAQEVVDPARQLVVRWKAMGAC